MLILLCKLQNKAGDSSHWSGSSMKARDSGVQNHGESAAFEAVAFKQWIEIFRIEMEIESEVFIETGKTLP